MGENLRKLKGSQMHPAHLIRLNFLFIFSGCTSQRPHIGPTSALGHCGSRTFWEYDSGLAYFPDHVVIFFHPTLINSKNSKTFLLTPLVLSKIGYTRVLGVLQGRSCGICRLRSEQDRHLWGGRQVEGWPRYEGGAPFSSLSTCQFLFEAVCYLVFFLFLRGQLNRFQLYWIQNGQQTFKNSLSDFVKGSDGGRESSASDSSRQQVRLARREYGEPQDAF